VLARSVPGPGETWRRRYPQAGLFSQTVGYSLISLGRSGLERSRNDELTGRTNEIETVLDQLRGHQREGDNVRTTLDPEGQRVALEQLSNAENGRGSVVALDPRNGAIKVMASTPGFDPNEVTQPGRFAALNKDPQSPLFNRSTQAGYPPGSTFKVVTALAAIDSGEFTPSSTLSGKSGQVFSGHPLANDGGAEFGQIDMTTALTFSVNTYWAQVAEQLGRRTLGEYMSRLGFFRKPRLDYPRDQMLASGVYDKSRLLPADSDRTDLARLGIGQERLAVTPLQMALVAATVANGGKLMRPHLTDRIVDPDGRTVKTIEPAEQEQVVKPATAKAVGAMMTRVVDEGTGTAAALSGISVAGKTGTAERDPAADITQPWFIAYAPADDPEIAIAVTVEKTQGGFGGTVAAPIAKQVLEALLGNRAG
jgi:peptidoglycan glycosyltransferase